MSFVRLKTIGSAQYAYLVENYWTPKGSRQKTSKYLGRVHRIEPFLQKSASTTTQELPTTYEELIKHLINEELTRKAFTQEGNILLHPESKIQIDLNEGFFSKNKKPIVIESHEGFICEHTYKELLHFRPQTERFEKDLANTLLAAGIAVRPEHFITIYEAAKQLTSPENKTP